MNTTKKVYFFILMLIALPVLIAGLGRDSRVVGETNSAPLPNSIPPFVYGMAVVVILGILGYGLLYGRTWAKGTVVGLISFACTGLTVEGICALLLHWKEARLTTSATGHTRTGKPGPIQQTNFHLVHYNAVGMSRPAPGQYQTSYSIQQSERRKGNEILVEKTIPVTYHIDSLSRRITPFKTNHATGNYALFPGCSFTYGEAVSDTSTLPYFFGQQSGYRPYNYGVSGHSPTQMLALLQTTNLRKQVAEKNGIAIYTYIDDHLARVAPRTKWINKSNGYLPYVNPATVRVDGSYAQKYPVRLSLVHWLYKSNIARLFNIDFPKRYSTEDYQRFVNIVRKVKERYRQQFGNDKFYVVIFPAYPISPVLRQLFEQAHIRVIDYSNLFVWKTTYDGMHPDSEAYERVAQKLTEDLQGNRGQPIARLPNAAR